MNVPRGCLEQRCLEQREQEMLSELECRNWGQGEDEDTLKIVSFSLCLWEPRLALVTNRHVSA